MGVLEVLAYCKRVGANCVFTSTAGVYKPTVRNIRVQETHTIQPSNLYSISKWLAEKIMIMESTKSNVKTIILRLFNVYGYNQNPSFFMSYLIDCLLNNKIMVLKHPKDYRDFIYIDDVVSAIIKGGELRQTNCEILNIGSGVSSRNMDVVKLVEKIFDKKFEIELVNSNQDNPSSVVADIAKAKERLNWDINFDLQRGLETIKKQMVGALQ